MHVGWVALLSPPAEGSPPSFVELRDHIAGRLARAPRYRQKIAPVPFGLNDPLWIDDDRFDVTRHVRRAREGDTGETVQRVMSTPLDRTRPLWELSIADELADGRLGIVGKAHHCMVDGIAAVELAALLLDPTPEPPPAEPDDWRAAPPPGKFDVLTGSVKDRLTEQLDLLRWPARLARSPRRVVSLAQDGHRAARALVNSFLPLAPPSMLNRPNSPLRHLALLGRELEDFRRIKRHFRTSVNDVVLAASSGGMRRFVSRYGEEPRPLKTMVPVNLRGDTGRGEFGNRISFLFVELPCDEPDPVRRLLDIRMQMSDRKESGGPQGGDSVLKLVSHAPHQLQHVVSRMVSSPRTFNLVVSNIPGPREPLYMRGCELQEVYPIVPLADKHALSIGITTIKDGAFFGIYADRELLPDAELLARDIDASVDELLAQV
jgi:WS/DGAT/MGAT family acyltransferase